MKTKDIADQYQIDKKEFERYMKENDYPYSTAGLSMVVDDDKVYKYVLRYKEAKAKAIAAANAEKNAEIDEAARKKKAMAEMLISSGFNFDGYTIVKYSGYISGDDATKIPRGGWFTDNNDTNLTNALVKIRRQALLELKEAAYNLGCNAIIGVDFDYLTLEPETVSITGHTALEPYVICVTANGNAVIIQKKTETPQRPQQYNEPPRPNQTQRYSETPRSEEIPYDDNVFE